MRYFCLSLLVLICGVLFSACSHDVYAKTIYFRDFSTNMQIETNQRIEATVAMTPSNVTNKEFVAYVVTEGCEDLLSFEFDYKNMTLVMIATGDLGEAKTVTLRVKLKAKNCDTSSTIQVKIVTPDSPTT